MTKDQVDDVDAILMVHDVHSGFPAERGKLAAALVAADIGPADVDLLARHVATGLKDDRGKAKVLAALLGNREECLTRLADVRRVAEAMAANTATPKLYQPQPTEGEDPTAWSLYRRRQIARCRLHGDRKPLSVVAKELGVTEAEAQRLADEGMADRPVLTPIPKSAAETESDRRAEFRHRMQADRVRRFALSKTRQYDVVAQKRAEELILAEIRTSGTLDIQRILRAGRETVGALATLEADIVIQRTGAPDHRGWQPYRIVPPAEKEAVRAIKIEADRRAMLGRPRPE